MAEDNPHTRPQKVIVAFDSGLLFEYGLHLQDIVFGNLQTFKNSWKWL